MGVIPKAEHEARKDIWLFLTLFPERFISGHKGHTNERSCSKGRHSTRLGSERAVEVSFLSASRHLCGEITSLVEWNEALSLRDYRTMCLNWSQLLTNCNSEGERLSAVSQHKLAFYGIFKRL